MSVEDGKVLSSLDQPQGCRYPMEDRQDQRRHRAPSTEQGKSSEDNFNDQYSQEDCKSGSGSNTGE